MKPLVKKLTWRSIFFVASILYAFVLVVGSTYAWTTYSDERINRTETENVTLNLEIIGEQSVVALDYTKAHTRNLRVKNANRTPAIVRVSLEEVLLAFEMDLTEGSGTGNVRTYPATEVQSKSKIDKNAPDTWLVGSYLATPTGTYQKAANRHENQFLKNQTRQAPFAALHLKMPNVVDISSLQGGSVEKKWVYQEEVVNGQTHGFFYYSDVLYYQQESTILVEDIRVAAKDSQDSVLENQYKASLYTLNTQLEGGLANIEMLKVWNHAQNAPIAKVYQQKLQGNW